MSQGRISIEGRIMAANNQGEKRISRNYTYGYMVLSVQVGADLYSVLVSSSKINTYGFLPRIGQYVHAEGIRSPGRDGFHDYSLSHLSTLEHIEPPKKKLK
ncbi:MAG: hypothetical protein KGD66_00850 [Candidatus Lokiarchaeota archaeon]|nr:hypothetical protein [Candidatus Lokiarchaeota archaeon]